MSRPVRSVTFFAVCARVFHFFSRQKLCKTTKRALPFPSLPILFCSVFAFESSPHSLPWYPLASPPLMRNMNVLPHLTKASVGPMWGPSVCVFCTRTGILCAPTVFWEGVCGREGVQRLRRRKRRAGLTLVTSQVFALFLLFFFRLSLFFLFFTSEFFFCRNSSVYPGARVERVGVG